MTKSNITLPQDWQIKTLAQIGTFSKGKGITKAEIVETGKPCIRYGQIYSEYNYFVEEFKSFINDESANNSERIYKNDLLFAGSGETLEDIGKCVAYIKDDEAYAGGDIIILRPNSEDAHYLGYLFNNDDFKKQTFKLGQGHSVVHIYSSSLKNVKITLPPLPEQQKIAKILATWDKAITIQQKLISSKKENKKAVMKMLLTGEVRFKGFSEEWKEVKFGDISIKKSSSLSANSIELLNGDYKVYGANGLLQCVDFYKEEEPYISIVKDGAGVGRTLMCDAKSSVLGTLDIIKSKKNIDLYFIFLLTKRINFLKYVIGSTIPHIYFKDYSLEKIKLPSYDEQVKISSLLFGIEKEINALQIELIAFQKQKQGLMQQLLTGKVRVKN
jgi:type I restriction enzyme S subunit